MIVAKRWLFSRIVFLRNTNYQSQCGSITGLVSWANTYDQAYHPKKVAKTFIIFCYWWYFCDFCYLTFFYFTEKALLVLEMAQNKWLAPSSTRPFTLPRPIKWVPWTSGDIVVKSKRSPYSGSKLRDGWTPSIKEGP